MLCMRLRARFCGIWVIPHVDFVRSAGFQPKGGTLGGLCETSIIFVLYSVFEGCYDASTIE
jgi:hypothetical protein